MHWINLLQFYVEDEKEYIDHDVMVTLVTKNQIPESDNFYLVESVFDECYSEYDGFCLKVS